MTQNRLTYNPKRGLCYFLSTLQIFLNLVKNPWISSGGACNHNTVASGLCQHRLCILRRHDIAVTDNRNTDCLLHGCNHIPICFPTVILLSRASVNRHGSSTRLLRRFRQRHGLHIIFTKSFAEFHRHRFVNRFHRLLNNFSRQRNIVQKSRTLPIVDYFRNRTPHIDIQNIKISFLNPFCLLAYNIGVSAKKLQGDRTFPVVNTKQIFCISIVIHNSFGAYHLRANQIRPLLLTEQTKWQVGNACHWC